MQITNLVGIMFRHLRVDILVALLVTVADRGVLNIGAAFWGLLAGIAVSNLLERGDFRHAVDS